MVIQECSNDIGNCPCASCMRRGHGYNEIHCKNCIGGKGWKMYNQDLRIKPKISVMPVKTHFTFD